MRRPDTTEIYLHLALRLFQGQEVTSRYIRDRWGVSRTTAQRYITRLEAALPVVTEEMWVWGPTPSLRLTMPR